MQKLPKLRNNQKPIKGKKIRKKFLELKTEDSNTEHLRSIFSLQKQNVAKSVSLVGTNAKMEFFDTYRSINRIRDRNTFNKLKTSPSVALLTELEHKKLYPLSLGIVKRSGREDHITVQGGLSERYVRAFSRGISKVKALEKIDIKGNKLSKESSFEVLSNIQSPSLKFLNISSNIIGFDSVQKISEMINSESSKLKVLDLENTNLSDSSVEIACEYLETNSSIKQLNLAKNNLRERSGEALGKMLKINTSLKILDLHWNQIYEHGAAGLFKGLEQNKKLRQLDLSWNSLGTNPDGMIEALTSFLAKNKGVRHFDISYNSLNLASCLEIQEAMEVNHSILGFHCLGNRLRVDELGYLHLTENLSIFNDHHSFKRMFDERPRIGENCWLCEEWTEFTFFFPNPFSSQNPIFFHCELDDWKPILMTTMSNRFKLKRVFPTKEVRFFFSDLEGTIFAIGSYQREVLEEPIHLMSEYYSGYILNLVLHEVNFLKPMGKPCKISNPFSTKPRKPFPAYVPPPVPVEKPPWDFRNSIFKDYVVDHPALMAKCFEFDWEHSRLPNMIRNIEELERCKEILRENYYFIRQTYKVLSMTNFSEIFSISQNSLFEFFNEGNVFDPYLYRKEDWGVNWNATIKPLVGGQIYNPGNALVRYEFLEMLTRVAYDKYYKSKMTNTVCEAVERFLDDTITIMREFDYNIWREKYFCEEIDRFLHQNETLLKMIYNKYSGRKSLPSQKPFMSIEEFRELCARIGVLEDGNTTRTVDEAYSFAMMTHVDEIFKKKHMEMGLIEFYEALARVVDTLEFKDEDVDETDLAVKLHKALPLLINIIDIGQFKRFSSIERAETRNLKRKTTVFL